MIDRNHIVYDEKENYKYRYIIEDSHCMFNIFFFIYTYLSFLNKIRNYYTNI